MSKSRDLLLSMCNWVLCNKLLKKYIYYYTLSLEFGKKRKLSKVFSINKSTLYISGI